MQEILGEKVYRHLQDIPSPETIDILDIFRRAEDLDPHLPDILKLKPKVHPVRYPVSCVTHWRRSCTNSADALYAASTLLQAEDGSQGLKPTAAWNLFSSHQIGLSS